MKPEQKAIHMGAVLLICALFLRLLSNIPLNAAGVSQLMIFLQTGRLVSAADQQAVQITAPSEPVTVTVHKPLPPAATFSAKDAAAIQMRNTSGYGPDLEALLLQSLQWNLYDDGPAVLILHAHGTESYADTEGYRTEDPNQNMLAIGDRVAALLQKQGIGVIHDRTLHDAASYSGSYDSARASIQQYLARYPSIRLILDLHRDAAEDAQGNQIDYTFLSEEGEAAKLVLVVGTDAGGQEHPHWQENLALAAKLQAALQSRYPDSCRPLQLRPSCYNQDLSTGSLLVEVGAAGNTRQEALLAADLLVEAILDLAGGANLQ